MGNIQTEDQIKDTSLFNQILPTFDSDKSVLLDIFGVSRTITITGIFTGTTTALNTFITAIETIANGSQTGVTFASSLTTFANKKVFVKNFRWSFIKGTPNKIDYSLELIEGA